MIGLQAVVGGGGGWGVYRYWGGGDLMLLLLLDAGSEHYPAMVDCCIVRYWCC